MFSLCQYELLHVDFPLNHSLIPSPPHCSRSWSPAPAHFSQAMFSLSTPQTCHSLGIHQMPSDFPFFPHYLTAPPKYTPVLTSLIYSAVTWTSPPTSSICISSLISHSLHLYQCPAFLLMSVHQLFFWLLNHWTAPALPPSSAFGFSPAYPWNPDTRSSSWH